MSNTAENPSQIDARAPVISPPSLPEPAFVLALEPEHGDPRWWRDGQEGQATQS